MVAVSILVLRYAPPDEATDPVFLQDQTEIKKYERRRKAISNIVLICFESLILTSGASARFLPVYLQYIACIVGGLLLLCSSVLLSHIDQYNGQSNFGNSGGFLCPFVPWLPILCITVNIYLLINLG
ncbi:cationic amino acid transporter 2 [Rhynchospora pubera]|uniref:Cationic amino acid transporter 2 n=1 Tax=Rhynchospora pubera TaxID=906938 RepID=A0AAV8HJU0_9POAL|nr:cationic amino acid transporter 2 [Rhynchospora pubera]